MKYRFKFHYNKPLSRQLGQTTWSVHVCGKCHYVQLIDCRVPVKSRSQKRQPYAVMVGDAETVELKQTPNGRLAIIH